MNAKPSILIAFFILLVFPAGKISAQEAADTSKPEDWKTNCALYRQYHNKLIFSGVETTDSTGKRTMAWSARNRAEYLATFQKLLLDGIPRLKEIRDQIIKKAGSAPGGSSVTISPELGNLVALFWKDIEVAAKKHGVSCGSK